MEFLFNNRCKINVINCVYLIKNIKTNKVYVGSSINLKKRIISHYNLLMKGKHINNKLQNTWNKYGSENFKVIIIEENLNSKNLIAEEQYYIDKFDSVKHGYNLLPIAGSSVGNKWTDDAKIKYSKLKKSLNLGNHIIQYDLYGNKINEFPNMVSAAKFIGLKNSTNIGLVCRKKRKTFGGYIWEYKDPDKQKKYGFHEFKVIKKIICPHCGGSDTKKSGFLKWNGNKKQTYKCNFCKKRFNDNTNKLCGWGKNIERNKKIVELFKNNSYNVSEISKELMVSELLVKRVLKKYDII